MLGSSCLITSSPTFNPPPGTAPFLVDDLASPSVRGIVLIQAPPISSSQEFSAPVRSEDNGQDVLVKLYVDYGEKFNGEPFREVIQGEGRVPASTMDSDQVRTAMRTWRYSAQDAGCHRFTLIVSHRFADTECPANRDDSDTVTWNAYVCTTGNPCPDIDVSACLEETDSDTICPLQGELGIGGGG